MGGTFQQQHRSCSGCVRHGRVWTAQGTNQTAFGCRQRPHDTTLFQTPGPSRRKLRSQVAGTKCDTNVPGHRGSASRPASCPGSSSPRRRCPAAKRISLSCWVSHTLGLDIYCKRAMCLASCVMPPRATVLAARDPVNRVTSFLHLAGADVGAAAVAVRGGAAADAAVQVRRRVVVVLHRQADAETDGEAQDQEDGGHEHLHLPVAGAGEQGTQDTTVAWGGGAKDSGDEGATGSAGYRRLLPQAKRVHGVCLTSGCCHALTGCLGICVWS